MPRIIEDQFRWTHTGSTGSPKAHKVNPEASAFSFWFSGTFGSSATGSS